MPDVQVSSSGEAVQRSTVALQAAVTDVKVTAGSDVSDIQYRVEQASEAPTEAGSSEDEEDSLIQLGWEDKMVTLTVLWQARADN